MKNLMNAVLSILCALLLLSACGSSKAVKKGDEGTAGKGKQGLEPVTMKDLSEAEAAQVKKVLNELEDIPFDFDSYTIPTQGLDIIKKDVGILNDMLEQRGKYIRITVEGHTDERGTEEYNLALGERRAKTVKEYLLNVGFREEQVKIISYGEERPKVGEHTVEAWAANRRAHLVVE